MIEHSNGECKEHSGICTEVAHLVYSDKEQWREIYNVRKIMISTLVSTIFTLIGVIVNLALWALKVHP